MVNEYGEALDKNGYAPSVLQPGDMQESCFLCGENGEMLDRHEVFFGSAYRQKSKRLGLWVCICHGKCYLCGGEAVHNNRETDLYLKEQGQLAAMERYGWDEEKFRAEFGRSYLED